MPRLRPSSRYTLIAEGADLILSGGADELYLLDELGPADAPAKRELQTAFKDDALERLGPEFGLVLTRLERLGAVERHVAPAATIKVAAVASALAPALLTAVARLLPATVIAVESGADLTFVVRTTGTLLDAALLQPSDGPCVLVDLGYHHTMSVGPLVWPGETACLQCLVGRIRQAWGDPPAPPSPSANEALPLAAGWCAEICRRFASDGTHAELVEHCVAVDLRTLASQRERVHRLPWCPRCFPAGAPVGAGSFSLPWVVS